MILDKEIKIRWNPNNVKYYAGKGYVFTKYNDMFNVNICDLLQNSHVLVHVKCDVCECDKHIIYREYYSNIQNGSYYSCSRKCGIDKKIQTVLKRYGVKNVSQLDVVKKRKEQTNIVNYGEIYMKYFPKYNLNSISYLDILSKLLNISIKHALNGGEKKFVRYYVDGYIEKYNICIEWDEKEHNIKSKRDRDNKKDIFLSENFGCYIVRINEREFMNDMDNQILLVGNKISDVIKKIKEKHGK